MTRRPKTKLASRADFHLDPLSYWVKNANDIAALMEGESYRGGAVLARAYMEIIANDYLDERIKNDPQNRAILIDARETGLDRKIKILSKLKAVHHTAITKMKLIKHIGNRYAHRPELRSPDEDDQLWSHFSALEQATMGIPQNFEASRSNYLLGVALHFIVGHFGDWGDRLREAELEGSAKGLPG